MSADGGATFSTSGIAFTYFEFADVGVSALTPRGGPHLGGTRVRVGGRGFADYRGALGGERRAGLNARLAAGGPGG